MDAELIAVMLAFGLGLVPIALAFRTHALRLVLALCWLGALLALTPGVGLYRAAHALVEPDNRPVERLRGGYVGSSECLACHPREYDSWKHSWHRTMTQVASPSAIFGDFDNVELETQGWKTKLERRGDRYFARVFDETLGSHIWREIVLTTGSHHMQAYWYSRGPGKPLGQLQFTYLKNDKKWVPRAAVFLIPPALTAIVETGRWNTVCIQCHTTRGRPGMSHEHSPIADSDAVEFGIACEACHGPGGEHAKANRANPARRYAQHFSEGGDDSIVNAARLTKQRSAEICGQCHGVGDVPDDVPAFFRRGFDYRAGDVFDESGRTLVRGGDNFRLPPSPEAQAYHDTLFWRDGMVRVSGRETNGLYDSPCFESGEMTCLSCHALHQADEDPRSSELWADDMLQPDMRTDRACVQCHAEFEANPAAAEAHSHHPAGSTGSECMNCHMPYTTWGLLKAIRQHTIDTPSARSTVETGRSNACNACHVDETLAWAADQMQAWYGHERPELSENEKTIAASLLGLLEGDAGQRALAAWTLGWKPAQDVAGTDWIAPQLAPLLEDPYDVVRYAAARSLRSLPGFEKFEYDYIGPEDARAPAKRAVWKQHAAQRITSEPSHSASDDPARARRLLLYSDGSHDRVALARLLEHRDDRKVTLAE